MIGLLLGIIGTFFGEIRSSIEKHKCKKHHFLKLGVISSFFGMLVFLITILYKLYFLDISIVFNKASIPLLGIRLFLEIIQSYFTIIAIKYSDRSTFSIIRILTIPLLIIVDILIGYSFSIYSYIGISIIMFSFLIFNTKLKTINLKGWYYVLITAINAVFTLSLFKYSITNYGNSVEVDQFIMIFGIFIFFLIYNFKKNKCCALKLIIQEKQFLLQGLAIGLSSLFISYSYLYLNASEATTIKRALEMFWSIGTGFFLFKEKNIIKKIVFCLFIITGLGIMIL